VFLSELIQEDMIRIGLKARDKWEAIEELVDVLVAAHEIRLNDRPAMIEAVNIRERSFSTGLKYGLALPHGSVDCVKEAIAALGTSEKGIDFESADGAPARLIILLVIPKAAFQQHVRTLAGISRLASQADLREAILAADSAKKIAALLEGMKEEI
jgi:mannitol/fructose-specific phosphotransferase system IIA component (Ntr-type)